MAYTQTADQLQFLRSQNSEVLLIQLIAEVSIRHQCNFNDAVKRIYDDVHRSINNSELQYLLLGSLAKAKKENFLKEVARSNEELLGDDHEE